MDARQVLAEALRLSDEERAALAGELIQSLEILAMLDEADASLARGEGIPITEESMKALAEDAKQRLRRRLAAERESRASELTGQQ